RHLELLEAVQAAPRRSEPVGDLRRLLGAENDEESAPFDVAALLAQLQRERGRPPLQIAGQQPDQRRLACRRAGREPPFDADRLEALLGENSRDDDRGEQHAEDEKEQVVAGVDRGQPDPDGEPRVPASEARERQPAPPGRRRLHSGTGTCSTRSRPTRSAASRAISPPPGPRPASVIRCARTGTHSSFTSSGSTYPRPRSSARARATPSSAIAPRGEAPSETSGVFRVAA